MWRERSMTMKRVRSREEYKVKERGVRGEREREREKRSTRRNRGVQGESSTV